jgi:hypothetical protein
MVGKTEPKDFPMAETVADDDADWWEFRPANDYAPGSVIGMQGWLDAPAGKHGAVRITGDRFAFADGTRAKFWGVNHGNENCAPPKEIAPIRATRLAKYGVNGVRLHKFTWHGKGQGIGREDISTELTDDGWDRLDFYVAELKKRGIYHGWSHIFGHRPRPGDKSRLLAYDEVMNGHTASYLRGSTYGLVMFAPDLQALNIELTVNMLRHRNPYTGKTYAEEPALAFVEMQNEDDIFFPSTHDVVMRSPRYKQLLCEQFTEWTIRKYGTEAKALAAWGVRALNAYPDLQKNESFAARNIYPIPHSWYHGPAGLKDAETKGARTRMLDAARFLYETQSDFYTRFGEAIRKAGYDGPLIGSCWAAGEGIPHYYNLLSDANVGYVDRHNYHGGQGGGVSTGKNDNHAMVDEPGSGLLSTGMQQVRGKPFGISEWTSLVPNEWVAEGPAIIATYGMGLQGWDASYEFANDLDRFNETIQTHGPWVVDSPTQIGLYPALARMVYRGDVSEGKSLPPRHVSLPDLQRGELGFTESSSQSGGMGDEKRYAGVTVPNTALAVGRVEVAFAEKSEKTQPVTLDAKQNGLRSNTGELFWHHTGKARTGYFTVNTAATKAAVGFLPRTPVSLGDISLRTENTFVCAFLTALNREEDLSRADHALLTVVARARNTGMRYNADGSEVLALGTAPIRMEPVRLTLTFTGKRKPKRVHVLDNDGRRQNGIASYPIDPRTGGVSLDGARDRTLYYEIEY